MVVLGGRAVSYERGTPVNPKLETLIAGTPGPGAYSPFYRPLTAPSMGIGDRWKDASKKKHVRQPPSIFID